MNLSAIVAGLAVTICGAYLTLAEVVTVASNVYTLQIARPVEATIVSVGIQDTELHSNDRNHATMTVYAPAIKYKYKNNGKILTGDNYSPTSLFQSGSWAQDIVKKYHPGQKTKIYVVPNSQQNFLHKELTFIYFALLLAGIFMTACGAAVTCMGITATGYPLHRIGPRKASKGPPMDTTFVPSGSTVFVLVFGIGGLATLAYYYYVAPPPYSIVAYIFSALWAVISLPIAANKSQRLLDVGPKIEAGRTIY